MVSDMPQEIPRRSKRHLGTGGSGYTGAFERLGESPPEGDGTVHTISDRPPVPDPDLRNPKSRRVIRDRTPGGGSSEPVEPSSDH
jgi:hypothetical protein